ncbi:membrane protein [Gordonia crocea]|uniref:Membrane protein n=1 Tax=Gordonia crocea TaxID=589162 RepID=A0A7M4BQ46_9ACTN|nr:membrane protein [Gordonia crocea]
MPLAPDHDKSVRRWSPSIDDPLVAPGSARIGGPVGRHAAIGRSRMSALRVLFALALLGLALGWSGKTACLQETPAKPSAAGGSTSATDPKYRSADDGKRLNWDNQREWYSLCFTRIPPTYTRKHLADGLPYWTSWQEHADGKTSTHRLEDPVGIGFFAYGAAWLTGEWQGLHERWGVPSAISPVVFFTIVAIVLALCWLVTIWALVKISDERRWFVWVAALSPVIVVHAFTSFDLLTVMLVMTGLLAWDRRRWWPAGILFGLACTTAMWPLLVLFAIVLTWIAGSAVSRDGLLRTFVATFATWLVVNLVPMFGATDGWALYWRFWTARAPEPDSVYGALAILTKINLNVTVVNIISLVLVLAVVATITALVIRAPRPFTVYEVAFLLLAGVLIVAKAWSPQSALWLVPLAVLAVRSSRVLMAWMLVEALTWVPRAGVFLAADHHWLPPQFYPLAVVIRIIAVVGVCLHIVWEHYDEPAELDEPLPPHMGRSPSQVASAS